jgi:hypothetical protein
VVKGVVWEGDSVRARTVFMETDGIRQNGPIGPEGYSIAHLSMVDSRSMHVAIAFNGGIIYDNGDNRAEEYGTIQGFFVMYDLDAGKAKLIKKPRRKRKKYAKRVKG